MQVLVPAFQLRIVLVRAGRGVLIRRPVRRLPASAICLGEVRSEVLNADMRVCTMARLTQYCRNVITRNVISQ